MRAGKPLRVAVVCKRRYTGKDIIEDRFGRLFHLPVGLAGHGWDVLVVAADYWSNEARSLIVGSARFEGIPWTVAKPLFWAKVADELDGFEPDVVVGSGDTHLGWVGLRVADRLGVPFVFDLYDNYSAFASARVPGMRRLFRRVVAGAGLVTVVTEALAALACAQTRSRLIPNGVDLGIFGRCREKMPAGTSDSTNPQSWWGISARPHQGGGLRRWSRQ